MAIAKVRGLVTPTSMSPVPSPNSPFNIYYDFPANSHYKTKPSPPPPPPAKEVLRLPQLGLRDGGHNSCNLLYSKKPYSKITQASNSFRRNAVEASSPNDGVSGHLPGDLGPFKGGHRGMYIYVYIYGFWFRFEDFPKLGVPFEGSKEAIGICRV